MFRDSCLCARSPVLCHSNGVLLEPLEPRVLLSAVDDRVSVMSSGSMPFVANAGQWDEAVRFASSNGAGAVLHTDAGPILQLRDVDDEGHVTQACEVAVEFPGAAAITPQGLEAEPGVYNFLTGPQETWRTGLSGYAAVGYAGLWDGVDLVTRGSSEGLKYEFHLAPGVDAQVVQLRYAGADELWIDDDGALHVVTPLADLIDSAPEIYQDLPGGRVYFSGGYVLLGADTVGFEVAGAVDPSAPLVIDPRMNWASYLGGADGDEAQGVAADSAGNVIVGGRTSSTGWVSGGYDETFDGVVCGFVTKLTPAGAHVWSTYIGEQTWVEDVAVDDTNQIIAVGTTGNGAWDVDGPWDDTYDGLYDGFVICLSSDGGHEWSSYIGGYCEDRAHAVAIGRWNHIFIGGQTSSWLEPDDENPPDDKPWISGGDRTYTEAWRTDYCEGFLVHLLPDGRHSWSTYMGDEGINGNTIVNAVYADARNGPVFAAGVTWAPNRVIPEHGEKWIRNTLAGVDPWQHEDLELNNDNTGPQCDGFVIRYLDSTHEYWAGSYIGGAGNDWVNAVTLDGLGVVYVGGKTNSVDSADWPFLKYSQMGTLGASANAFVCRLGLTYRASITYVRFLGGDGADVITGLASDQGGDIWACGTTSSDDWLDSDEETAYRGGSADAFVVGLERNRGQASGVIYLGGGQRDEGTDIALSPDGGVLVSGWTESDDGWVHTGWDTTYGGSEDGFVAKVGAAQNYVILFSGGGDAWNNHERYYDNIERLYLLLLNQYHVPAENIYVLYADGNDPGIDRSDGVNSDMAFVDANSHLSSATLANLKVACDDVAALVRPHDHFFFWSFDHGVGTYEEWFAPLVRGEEVLCGWHEDIPDEKLAELLAPIHTNNTPYQTGYCTYVMCQCFSGGMLDNITIWDKRFGCAATNHHELSWGDGFAAAFTTALERGINTTFPAFNFALRNDSYAQPPTPDEHPWCTTNGGDFPIFFNIHNNWPVLPAVRQLQGDGTNDVAISYDLLRAAADEDDPDGTPLGFLIAGLPEGTLTLDGEDVVPYETVLYPGQTLVWTPPGGATGVVEAFQIMASDGTKGSETAAVWVAVDEIPGGPDAADDTATVAEDSTDNVVDVLGNDTGTGTLEVLDVGHPAHGEVRVEGGQVLYTPAADFAGTDSFTYFMTDEQGDFVPPSYATVTVTVTAANDDPVAVGEWQTVMEDSQDNELDVLSRDFDPDGDDLTVTDVADASDGTVELIGGSVFYTPPGAWTGEATFAYTISDGHGGSAAGTSTVTVEPLDGGPVAAVSPSACDYIECGDSFLLEWNGGRPGVTAEVWTLGPSGLFCTTENVPTLDRQYVWDSTGLGEGLYAFRLRVDPGGGGALYHAGSGSWVQALAAEADPPAAGAAAAPPAAQIACAAAFAGEDDAGTDADAADAPPTVSGADAPALDVSPGSAPENEDFVYFTPLAAAPTTTTAPDAGATFETQWPADALAADALVVDL